MGGSNPNSQSLENENAVSGLDEVKYSQESFEHSRDSVTSSLSVSSPLLSQFDPVNSPSENLEGSSNGQSASSKRKLLHVSKNKPVRKPKVSKIESSRISSIEVISVKPNARVNFRKQFNKKTEKRSGRKPKLKKIHEKSYGESMRGIENFEKVSGLEPFEIDRIVYGDDGNVGIREGKKRADDLESRMFPPRI